MTRTHGPARARGFSTAALLLAALCALLGGRPSLAQQQIEFDHFRTGFPLTGSHERVPCEACHTGGVFEGTPSSCGTCHSVGSVRAATAKPPDHIPTSNTCEDCHMVSSWSNVRFDHRDVTGPCASCHNGSMATGKPGSHVVTSADCGQCHRTLAWSPATFDHDGITTGCFRCHNGSAATGKPQSHPLTSNDCETCHTTRTWAGARFDHTGITTGCIRCHDNVTATGKPQSHPMTGNDCETCHTTSTWANATFDHSTVTGNCMSCHNGSAATGKGSGHFVTSQDCNACHSTTRWTPIRYSHSSPAYPDHGARLECRDCHTSNTEVASWPFAAFKPDCAGCHFNDYESGPHKKTESPETRYTASELRDCSGACHVYTDTTLTTIQRSRSGEHSARRGDF